MTDLAPRRQAYSQQIKLLSGGFSCRTAFPSGEITVYPWDTTVDDWLSERVKKGDRNRLLFELVGKVCNLNSCPIEKFVVGDVNTVLLVSRSIRYSNVVEYACACPHCRAATTEKIKIPDELGRIGEKGPDYAGFDNITLPGCKDIVSIRPLLIGDEFSISDREDAAKKQVSDRVMHILKPITEINDGKPDTLDQLFTWYNALSPSDASFLEDKENEMYPHLDTAIPHVCDECDRPFKHTLDFNQDFFRSSL